ncbi:aryl hydrocarbon receptor S homeolog [Xenopus laevis]|uniref:Aryl hydrocarbon receptor n=1 Tax=Xenopus laevis TaxID=8355 RepID=Q7SZH9_XENLA|nr:aryl hydrocarbon receptor S homeolog [Xenopus laevis]BAC79074.1 aryl hydrocarbon receptor [Xenopus laevis]
MNTNIIYAGRKRRKPVQKIIKPTQAESVKSNPSKRHRDRLNTELERLASLLPFQEEIISKLDKLSVLRLSVSYLRAKGFFEAALQQSKTDGNGRTQKQAELRSLEGELLLQALNGFVLVVASDGLVFFASSTIQDYLGFQQSDVIHQSVYELIHTEDRLEFQRQLHWAFDPAHPSSSVQRSPDEEFSALNCYKPEQLPPENSSFMERNFVCRLRCLLDNSSGFLAMNFQGRLKFLHGQNKKGKDGSILPPQLALFTLATPLQSPSILEIRAKNFIFRTKHKLDFTPIGCDAKGSMVLGYTEAELCVRGTGYQFIHAADMLYCAENHTRMIKTGESGMTVFRLLTRDTGWVWVQANARLVYKNGRPDYIIASQRALTEEEGAEHLRKRSGKLPFLLTTGEAVLYESSFPLQTIMEVAPTKAKATSAKGSSSKNEPPVKPSSLLGAMMRQDESVYSCPPASKIFSFDNYFQDLRSELSNNFTSSQPENCLPVINNNLKLEGAACSLGNLAHTSDCSEVFPESKNNELYNIMNSLGIDVDDLEMIQQDEAFFRNEFDYSELSDIDVADEILTYVQETLNKKTDCMFMNNAQPMPCVPEPSSITPNPMNPPQIQHPSKMMPQQLSQQMKHMQVNGMLTNWNSVNNVPPTFQEQQCERYNVSSINDMTHELYKSALSSAPYACKQEYMPYQEPSNLTQMDFDLGNVERSVYTNPTNLEGFLECLPQNSGIQECGLDSQTLMVTPQSCYSGAVSMYQCLPESSPATCLNQMQYNAVMAAQQPLLNKFQTGFNGGTVNETYAAPVDIVNSSPAGNHLPPHHLHHHPADSKHFPDLQPSGFM